MGHSRTYEAIVLHTHDIGEADRFVIFFTRERGRLAARAYGARKLMSRLGGSLLPLQHVAVDIKENTHGCIVASAKQRTIRRVNKDLRSLLEIQGAMEMLLAVLHDEEPLPEIFDLTLTLLRAPSAESLILPFTVRLLHLLGLFPESSSDVFSPPQSIFVDQCIEGDWKEASLADEKAAKLQDICDEILVGHIGKKLKVADIGAAMR